MKKKYFYLVMAVLFAALPFALASCSSDDDDEGDAEIASSGIVGTWEITAQSAEFGDIDDALTLLQFKKDGTFVQVTDEDGDVDIAYGKWTFSDNVLTMDNDELTLELQVTSQSKNKIVATLYGMYTMELTKVKDSKIEAYLKSQDSSGELKVNGTTWTKSSSLPAGFNDFYDGSDCYYVTMNFYRKGEIWYPDQFNINFNPEDGTISVGDDLADLSSLVVSYNENMYQNDESKAWKEGVYKGKSSGHAYVRKYVKHKSITIEFSNLKLNYNSTDMDNSMNSEYDFSHPQTLTLNGTVTFSYDD